MNWRVTYRANDGKQAVETIEAGSRNAVLKLIAARGLRAISVEESNVKGKPSKRPNGISKKTVIVLLVSAIAVIGIVCVFLHSDPASERAPALKDLKPPRQPKLAVDPVMREVMPQTSAAPIDALTAAPTYEPDEIPLEDEIPPKHRVVEMISVITNADGSVLERFRAADGKIRSRQSAPKPIFDNASDQLIAMAVSGAESGYAMPPMPVMDNADEEFLRSLENEITVDEDDPEEVKALKQNVIAIREEILRLMGEGRSFSEIIKEHRDIVNNGVEMRKEATSMIKDLVDSGDYEAAYECLEKVNEVLTGMGIQSVEMPLTDEERREQIRNRHRN